MSDRKTDTKMTDPVDTEALRDMGAALTADGHPFGARIKAAADEVDRLRTELHTARAGLGFMADMHERRRVKLERVEPENEHLRAVIENAPHDATCHYVDLGDGEIVWRQQCTCWKATAL